MRTLLSFRERNRIWHLFIHPSSRQLFVDWEQAAEHAVMNFRAAYDQYIGDAWFEHFLTDLQQKSPEFRTWWSQHNVQGVCDFYQEKELNHPQVGRLLLSSTVVLATWDIRSGNRPVMHDEESFLATTRGCEYNQHDPLCAYALTMRLFSGRRGFHSCFACSP